MLEAPPLPSLLYIYMFVAPSASLSLSLSLSIYICLWFVTRGREGLWAYSRQHSVLL